MDQPELEKLIAEAKADKSEIKTFFITYATHLIAGTCFVVGVIVGHLL